MSNGLRSNSLKGRTYALKMLTAQALLVLVLSLVSALWDQRIALTLFMGGMISVLANLWFALVVFRPPLGSPPGRMLVAFYLGEAGKIIIVALLFMLAFKRVPWVKEMTMGLVLLTGFIASQLIAWIYPLIKHRPGAN
jgi:ATP synthase protein I